MLKDRSMTLRRLYFWASNPTGRPPLLPPRRRRTTWETGVGARASSPRRGQPAPVAELWDLGGQPAARTTQPGIGGFIAQIRVIQRAPLCRGPGPRRVDEPDTTSNQPPPPTNQSPRRRRPSSTVRSTPRPRCRRPRTGDDASTPSATDQNPQADPAMPAHIGTGR